jgi:hypothetical protein
MRNILTHSLAGTSIISHSFHPFNTCETFPVQNWATDNEFCRWKSVYPCQSLVQATVAATSRLQVTTGKHDRLAVSW